MRFGLMVAIGASFFLAGCSTSQAPKQTNELPADNRIDGSPAVSKQTEESSNAASLFKVKFEERILNQLPAPVEKTEAIFLGVVEFENTGTSARNAKMGGAIAAMLIDRLAGQQQFRIIERAAAKQLLEEKSVDPSRSGLAIEEKVEPGSSVADFVVIGTYVMDAAGVSTSISLVRTADHKPVAQWTASGPVAQMPEVADQLAEGIARFFGVKKESADVPLATPRTQLPLVAVLKLSNLGSSTRLQPMENGFSDILQANLSTISGVRLVERQRVHDVLQEQRLGLLGAIDPRTAAQVGQLLGADQLVYGSFFEMDKRLHLQVRLVDVKSTEVLRSASINGDVEQFASIMSELTERIGAALSNVPPDAAVRLRREQPVHVLESALHYARGQNFDRRGLLQAAAQAYAQAIVIEPKNPFLHFQRCQSLFRNEAYTELIEAAEQALQQDFPEESREHYRWALYVYMFNSCWGTRDFARMSELTKQSMAEFNDPDKVQTISFSRALALVAQGNWDEGTELLEKATANARDTQDDAYIEFLDKLFELYWRESQLSGRGQPPERRQEAVRRALRVYDDLLKALTGRHDEKAQRIGMNAFYRGTSLGKEDPQDFQSSQAQELKTLQTGLAVLDWIPRVAAEGSFQLAEILEQREQWQEALAAHRKFQTSEYVAHDSIPCIWDVRSIQPTSWIDKQIESSFRIGRILELGLERRDEAVKSYQEFVHKHGLSNFRGPDVVAALNRLGADWNHPSNSILVWGGATDVRAAFAKLFPEAENVVHGVRTDYVTLAHLLPYRLVILARSGHRAYTPGQILALRSYIATGGCLLVILSPGWEPAAPSLHNALLSFFDASAGTKTTDREPSTETKPHPITSGISRVVVKNPVGLMVPAQSQLIRCQDDTVLAAMNYGRGRVVLAAFGQWFLPDAEIPANWPRQRLGSHWSSQVPVTKLPIMSGASVHTDLLKNVLKWLTENVKHDAESAACRQALQNAAIIAIAVEASALSWDKLTSVLSTLEQTANDLTWREELLWSAGELSQQLQYDLFEMPYCTAPQYGTGTEWSLSSPEFYQRLIEQFPASQLRPFAEWRLGDCSRRAELAISMKDWKSTSVFPDIYEANPKLPLAVFEKVTANEGTFAWSWTELRMGMLHSHSGDHTAAATHFERVAERMPAGAEKTLALMNLGISYLQLGRRDDAARQFELVSSFPDVRFDTQDVYANWRPPPLRGLSFASSHEQAASLSRALGRNK